MQFGVLLFVALASSAFTGFVRPVGVPYSFAAPYAVVRAPVTTYHHTVPTYTKVYAPVVPAVSTVHHTPTVSKVTNVDTYSTHHAVATPVAKVSTYTSPAVTAVHQVPAVTKVHTYTSPVVPAVHTVPAYTYRVGYPYYLGTYGYGLGYGLSPYGVNYGYGVDYATILKKKCKYWFYTSAHCEGKADLI